jgi:hypothetical protein
MSTSEQLSFDNMVGGPPQPEDVPPDEFIGVPEEEGGVERRAAMTIYTDQPVFEQGDIFIPRLRLTQGLTKEVQDGTAKPGQWVMSGYDPMGEITVIPLQFARRREFVDAEFAVHCKSDDAVTGVGDPGGECAKCPMNRWEDGPKGKRIAPKCTFIYSYIVYAVEYEATAVLEFKRTSINVGKSINTLIAQRGIRRFAITLKSSSNQGPKGTYYIAAMSSATVPDEVMRKASESF